MSASHLSFPARARLRVRGVGLILRWGSSPAWDSRAGDCTRRAQEPKGQPAAAAEPVGSVDDDDLLKAGGNNANWLMYGRTYDAQRYSPLKQINTEERRPADPGLDLPDGRARRLRVHAAGHRRHHVRDHALEPCLRDRLQDRLAALALPEVAAREPGPLLRRRQPGVRRLGRPALHGDARRPPRLPRPQYRRGGLGRRRSPSPATTARRSATSTRWPTARPSPRW